MSKKVVLIKLGGSVITNKEIPMELRRENLNRLVSEINQARTNMPETLFVVGHGSGSFAHVPASQYDTINGFKNQDSLIGMAIVQDSAAQLNRHVVHAFLEVGIPAVSLLPSNSLITKSRKVHTFFTDVFETYIEKGLFPVTQGDVILDVDQGCTIWSTEEVLAFFAQEFLNRNWQVDQIIHVTEVDGVYDANKVVIPKITPYNWSNLKKFLVDTRGFDVTGGMLLKVNESLNLAQKGASSKILSGLTPNNLYNALMGNDWYGTEITA